MNTSEVQEKIKEIMEDSDVLNFSITGWKGIVVISVLTKTKGRIVDVVPFSEEGKEFLDRCNSNPLSEEKRTIIKILATLGFTHDETARIFGTMS